MIRLLELRNERGMSQREAAQEFKISQSTYNNWENFKTQPSIEQLIEIANFFDVSVDYLIGRSENYDDVIYKAKNTKEEISLLNSFRQCSPEVKKNIVKLLESI